MSYRNVINITDRLAAALGGTRSPEDAFGESFSDLEDLVELTRDAGYHRSGDPTVRDRFAHLHGQLSAIAANLKPEAYHEQTWSMLQEALLVSARISSLRPQPQLALSVVPPLDLKEALGTLESDPRSLLQQTERELYADPDSITGAYLQAAALLALARLPEAIAAADTLAVRYPARHVTTISALAVALQGREEAALRRAVEGMHRRLEVRRPAPGLRIPGLRCLRDDEAELIRQVNVTLVQAAMRWLEELGWDDARRLLFIGLIAPSLSQSHQLLGRHIEEAPDDSWRHAARLGLIRFARWRCDFDGAAQQLEGMTGDLARTERQLLARDQSLLRAGEVELCGHGQHLFLSRTRTHTTISWAPDAAQSTAHSDRTPQQVADLFKDLAASWIASGFSLHILQDGPLPERDAHEPALTEQLSDVDRFFALYDAERLDDVLEYAERLLAERPHAAAAWGMKVLVHMIQGDWSAASRASARGAALAGCRSLAVPQTLAAAAVGDLGAALDIAMRSLALRLRTATPELPLALPGFPAIVESESDLLDQIEINAWRLLEEMLSDDDEDEQDEEHHLQGELIIALLAPNPATTIQQLEAMMPQLATTLALKASAATALARWRRYEGSFEEARDWLATARAALPGLTFTRDEARRLERDVALIERTEAVLRGYGVTVEIALADRLLYQTFTPDDGSQTATLTSWIEDPRPQAPPLAFRDAVVAWIESGFLLLGEGPTQ